METNIIYPKSETKTPAVLKASAPDIRIGPLDLSCVGISPCRECPRVRGNKELCCDTCERLRAYQYGRDYEHLPFSRVSNKRKHGRARA